MGWPLSGTLKPVLRGASLADRNEVPSTRADCIDPAAVAGREFARYLEIGGGIGRRRRRGCRREQGVTRKGGGKLLWLGRQGSRDARGKGERRQGCPQVRPS